MSHYSLHLNLHELLFLRFLNFGAMQNCQRVNFTEDYALRRQGSPLFKYVTNYYRKGEEGSVLATSSDNTVTVH